jgi:hypothetical protein
MPYRFKMGLLMFCDRDHATARMLRLPCGRPALAIQEAARMPKLLKCHVLLNGTASAVPQLLDFAARL